MVADEIDTDLDATRMTSALIVDEIEAAYSPGC